MRIYPTDLYQTLKNLTPMSHPIQLTQENFLELSNFRNICSKFKFFNKGLS